MQPKPPEFRVNKGSAILSRVGNQVSSRASRRRRRAASLGAKEERSRIAFGKQNEQPSGQISSGPNEKVLPQSMQSSSPDFEKAIRKPKKNATGMLPKLCQNFQEVAS